MSKRALIYKVITKYKEE